MTNHVSLNSLITPCRFRQNQKDRYHTYHDEVGNFVGNKAKGQISKWR